MGKRMCVFLIAVLMLVPLVLFASGSSEQTAAGEEPKRLEMWLRKTFSPDSDAQLQARIDEFADDKGVEVSTEFISVNQQWTKMNAAIEAGVHPDIAFLPYTGIAQYHDSGVLQDISPLIEELEQANGKMVPQLIQAVTQDGKQYGLPLRATSQIFYWRTDLLGEAGYNAPPETWEDVVEIGRKVTNPSREIYGFGIGSGKNCSDFEWVMRCIIFAYGGSLWGETDTEVRANSPEVKEAFQLVADMFNKHKITPPSAKNWDDSGNNKAYLAGQTAMTINPVSIWRALERDNSELLPKTKLTLLPKGPEGRYITGSCSTLTIMSKAQAPKLAREMFKYIHDKEWYTYWIEITAPLYTPVYSYMKDNPTWQKPFNKMFIDSIESFAFIGQPGTTTTRTAIPFNSRYCNATLQRMIVGGQSVDESVAQLEKDLLKLVKEQ